ncbi:MAG: hypothetical protein LC641_09425, partial [Spirochaeta sp.]|nr:hypothetical protein [Spirochaeta sp.]
LLRDSALILLSFAALTLVAALGLYLHSAAPQTEPQAESESSLPKTSADEPEQSADKPDHYSEAFENDLDLYLDDEDYLDFDFQIDEELAQSQEETNAPDQGPDQSPDQQKDKLLRRLSSEMERSTFNEEDLVLALVRSTPAESKHPSDTESQRRVNKSRLLDRLYSFIALEHTFKELTFTVDENIIAVIEPNNDLDGGIRRMENLMRKAEARAVAEGSNLHAGLSARAGRLTESPRLFKEAYTALRRAEHTKTRLMGFRPDPDLYRRFVAGETAGVEAS